MDGPAEANLWGTRCTDSVYAARRSVPTEDASTIRFIRFEKKDRYFFGHVEPKSWRDYVGLDHLLSSKYAKLRGLQELTLIGGGKNLQSNSEAMDCENAMAELHSTMISEGIEFSVPKLIIEMPPKNGFKRKDARRELHKKMREEDRELRLQWAFNMSHGIDMD